MDVFVNNEIQSIEDNSNLTSLMKLINMDERKGIAIAINNSVIPKTIWGEYVLHSNDKITIIRATQGG